MTFFLPLLLTLAAAPPAWTTATFPGPPPEATKRATVKVNGVELAYATWGHGPPLLLLHGGAGHGDQWANEIAAFADAFTVITVDARGHGRSTRDAKPMSYALMAEDLLALMDALQLPRAAMVGWSDGGIVALELASRHPERVSQLVLFGVNFDLTGTQKGSGSAAATAYWARCKQDYEQRSPTPKGWKEFMAALRPMWRTQPNFTRAQLQAIQVPTLVLLADHDELIRGDHVELLAKLLPHATLVRLEGVGHFALFQQPEAFNRAVLNFLRAAP